VKRNLLEEEGRIRNICDLPGEDTKSFGQRLAGLRKGIAFKLEEKREDKKQEGREGSSELKES